MELIGMKDQYSSDSK